MTEPPTALTACPWCNEEPLVTDDPTTLQMRGPWGVLCITGGCETNPHTFAATRAEAVAQWNHRGLPPAEDTR